MGLFDLGFKAMKGNFFSKRGKKMNNKQASWHIDQDSGRDKSRTMGCNQSRRTKMRGNEV